MYRADYAEIVKSMKVIERVIYFRWYPNRNGGKQEILPRQWPAEVVVNFEGR